MKLGLDLDLSGFGWAPGDTSAACSVFNCGLGCDILPGQGYGYFTVCDTVIGVADIVVPGRPFLPDKQPGPL